MKEPFPILYEDNHLLAVRKPTGLLTQPSGTDQENIEDKLKAWIKARDCKPGNVFLEAVHRLDKQAGGIVLFAKTRKSLSRIHEQIRNRRVEKAYLAITEHIPSSPERILEHWLIHDSHRANVVSENRPNAKLARLAYRVVSTFPKNKLPLSDIEAIFIHPIPKYDIDPGAFALLEIKLETGRYHQIRCQLARIGCPILGDEKYGSTVLLDKNHIALHHARMEFIHPVTKAKLTIRSY